jgi:putative heme-binding domain-containing protein
VLDDASVRPDVLALIGEGQIAALAPDVLNLLKESSDDTERSDILKTLGQLDSPEGRQAIADYLSHDNPVLADAALTTLVTIHADDELSEMLTRDAYELPLKKVAVRLLTSSVHGCYFLLTLIEDGKLSDGLQKEALLQGSRHPNANVRQLFAEHGGEVEPSATIAELDPKEVLALTGSTDRGRHVFMRSEADCMRCHRVGSEGNDVGPDLSMIGRKYGREALLEHIMKPAFAVAPEYTPYLIETEDGIRAGFVLKQNKRIVEYIAEDGEKITLPAEQVVSLRKQEGTLMPDLLLDTFKPQDVADLLAYLSDLRTTVTPITSWLAIGPFANENERGLNVVHPPEREIDFSALYDGDRGGKIGWSTYTPQRSGSHSIADLTRALGRKYDHIVAYYCVHLDSPEEQTVRFKLGSHDAVKVFVNGNLILTESSPEHASPDAISVEAPLKTGRNTLLVKLAHVSGSSQLHFGIESPQPIGLSAE